MAPMLPCFHDSVVSRRLPGMLSLQRSPLWKKYWLKKIGIEGYLMIWVQSISVASGLDI